MKTQEEIKQLAQEIHYISQYHGLDANGCFNQYQGFIKGYTKCQEDMADEIVNFHEWIRHQKPSELKYVGNVNGKCYDYKREYYTTKELYNIYNSLNKQD